MDTPTTAFNNTCGDKTVPQGCPDARAVTTSPERAAVALAIVSMVGLIIADYATWIELNVAVVYTLPLVFAAASRSRRLLWCMTCVMIAATFAIYYIQIPLVRTLPTVEETGLRGYGNPYLVDRCLTALTVLLSGAILQGWMFSLRAIEMRDAAIKQNNERLHSANEELVRQRKEIAIQNAELERRRREAEEVSTRKTQILASLAHDIRTPIQCICLLAETMRRTADTSPPDPREIASLAQRLLSHALSVGELLSDVIDLASFDRGQLAITLTRFSLNDLLREQARRLSPQAEVKGISLQVKQGLDSLDVCTDRAKLGRILANLTSNAIKFTSTGAVTLSFDIATPDKVRIDVMDTGCGIRPENLKHIFGEFYQEQPGPGHSGSGWGLGLSICRRLAGLLGGELQVTSSVGLGSTFSVVLPAGETPPSNAVTRSEAFT